MTPFLDTLTEAVRTAMPDENAPLIVHSDVLRARAAISATSDPRLLLERHIEALATIAGSRGVALPAFNYDYPRTRIYSPATDVGQVGALAEHARQTWATSRRGGPIFNFGCRVTSETDAFVVPCDGVVDPFGADSLFAQVHERGGSVLMYGAPFHTLTAIHYVERIAGAASGGGPAYRYDKAFAGVVRHADGHETAVTLDYHCRPMGKSLEYAWARLRAEAENAGLVRAFRAPGSEVLLVSLPALCRFWAERIAQDPLYLLDDNSREWVSRELDRLGRRFVRSDFEETP
jgi:aminoglycoside N3'-acetyltransferase